jgi:hypothetical protein
MTRTWVAQGIHVQVAAGLKRCSLLENNVVDNGKKNMSADPC